MTAPSPPSERGRLLHSLVPPLRFSALTQSGVLCAPSWRDMMGTGAEGLWTHPFRFPCNGMEGRPSCRSFISSRVIGRGNGPEYPAPRPSLQRLARRAGRTRAGRSSASPASPPGRSRRYPRTLPLPSRSFGQELEETQPELGCASRVRLGPDQVNCVVREGGVRFVDRGDAA